MLTRIVNLPETLNFFLFGARATGKSTLLNQKFSAFDTFTFDLLKNEELLPFLDSPNSLSKALDALSSEIKTVVIDEIQRAPLLLDIVQIEMAKKRFRFVLTGSSARKLKRGQANMLGGRAVSRSLWPLTCMELQHRADFEQFKMNWGGLPLVATTEASDAKKDLLRAYESTYLAEEVVAEQLVRNLNPFRQFLAVAAQMNGKIINTASIGRDLGVSHNTISSYYEILEDTLIGFSLPAYNSSIRKKLRLKSKFYLFDTGVTKALKRQLESPLIPGTSAFGDAFEHMVILECKTLCAYFKPDWQLSFLQSESQNEIDLVIDKGFGDPVFIEIKSCDNLGTVNLNKTFSLMKDLDSKNCFILSRDSLPKKYENNVMALPWLQGLKQIFEI